MYLLQVQVEPQCYKVNKCGRSLQYLSTTKDILPCGQLGKMWTAVALKMADTRDPSIRLISSADLLVTVASRGTPQSTVM